MAGVPRSRGAEGSFSASMLSKKATVDLLSWLDSSSHFEIPTSFHAVLIPP
jgi:hypothetical protein